MKRWLLLAIAAFATAGFIALGAWQVERRTWKLALIERVEQRVHAEPAAAPGPSEWAGLNRENAEYRRVTATGRFVRGRDTLVRAVTELGEGYWLMVPLQTEQGFIVLVNRGFVPPSWRANEMQAADVSGAGDARPTDGATVPSTTGATAVGATEPDAARAPGTTGAPSAAGAAGEGTVSITGLLRISEPDGAFLRSNAPAEDRWYSRDVEAIANAQHLTGNAPYFIDAEAPRGTVPDSSRPPVAGLTVVQFRNSHLQYAITWFALALMSLALGVRVARNR